MRERIGVGVDVLSHKYLKEIYLSENSLVR